jgi:hypothetical protein
MIGRCGYRHTHFQACHREIVRINARSHSTQLLTDADFKRRARGVSGDSEGAFSRHDRASSHSEIIGRRFFHFSNKALIIPCVVFGMMVSLFVSLPR